MRPAKEIRSRDQGYAQQGGDWFTVQAVSDIIGPENTVAKADALNRIVLLPDCD